MARVKIRDLLAKKEIQPGKKADLEKNDLLALLIAAASVFLPALLGMLLLVYLFILAWTAFF